MSTPDLPKTAPSPSNADSTRKLSTATDAIKQTATDVADQTRDALQTGQAHARDAGQTLAQTVKDNPLLAVGTAFGLGLAVSLLLKANSGPRY